MSLQIYINGKFYPKDQAKISVYDHGLLYGDGVFEGIRAYNGIVFKLDEHLKRLYESAHAIMLKIPLSFEEMAEAVCETCRRNNIKDGYIRLVVTRGVGDLGLNPNNCKVPQTIIIADKIQLYPTEFYIKGLSIITVPTPQKYPEGLSPRIKSLNYLNNIIAKIEALNSGAVEAIMLNTQGYVAECTGDNIFIVKNGKLITPPEYSGILSGITRNAVMEIAGAMKIRVEETILTRFDLFNSDECFLTGTAAEIVPVVNVDNRMVGNGKPGKITNRLINKFKKLCRNNGRPIYKR